MSTQSLRVAVVGGGVCGLTCAVALQKHGVDAQVYEAASQFGEIGAGVDLGRNAINILSNLGVYEDICTRANQVEAAAAKELGARLGPSHQGIDGIRGWFRFHSGMGEHEVLSDILHGVHRAVFMDALVQNVDPARAHFKKRCTHLSEHPSGKGMVIHFQDGTTAEADIVLGADGIKSVVRRYVTDTASLSVDPHLKFSNTICFRSLVPASKAKAAGCKFDYSERAVCMVGENRHLILFPVRSGTLINVVAFASDPDSSPEKFSPPALSAVQHVTTEEVLASYEGWGPEVTNLLSCMDDPTKWSINVVYPPIQPENWSRGPVTILGDAAHGMLPHLGAGAAQGLEDAYLLGQLLGHSQTNATNVEAVLRAYAAVRHIRSHGVWQNSKRAGEIWDGRAGYSGVNVDEVRSLYDYIFLHPADADLEAAEEILIKDGVFARSS
ncbi:hypothetical protein PHLGIDRAFT_112385 [Phlebiopsis gigantea 11061_1 CR5-6]|uniref:FAD-binding domain-containing protein n=1 Tax=Phlebiopsis gigantea (strain 11061_1 CR5-6) TaxID=745531 RepID=A0A0C3S300_PHLG1|nr:hypothetical protein PHLGIDRAFT_112385 [Phlebiopsis gigantea 11061_1 CR5-6]